MRQASRHAQRPLTCRHWLQAQQQRLGGNGCLKAGGKGVHNVALGRHRQRGLAVCRQRLDRRLRLVQLQARGAGHVACSKEGWEAGERAAGWGEVSGVCGLMEGSQQRHGALQDEQLVHAMARCRRAVLVARAGGGCAPGHRPQPAAWTIRRWATHRSSRARRAG